MRITKKLKSLNLEELMRWVGENKPITLTYYKGKWTARMDVAKPTETPNIVFREWTDYSCILDVLKLYNP